MPRSPSHLTKCCNPQKKIKKGKPNLEKCGAWKKGESIQDQWTPHCEAAFQGLKRSLTKAPVLAYADPSKPYELYKDASRDGLGGVLYNLLKITKELAKDKVFFPAKGLHLVSLPTRY